jgi:hypothetical protein
VLFSGCPGDQGQTPKEPVSVAATGISLTPASARKVKGTLLTLSAAITPADATNRNVTWTSSNTDVAKVFGNGLKATVSAVGTGTATITATTESGGFTTSCAVTVTGGLVVDFDGFQDESIDLTLSTGNDLSKSTYDQLTVSYSGTVSLAWYLDGSNSSGSTSSYTVSSSNISLGTHYLSVIIQNGTTWVSKEILFRVVE